MALRFVQVSLFNTLKTLRVSASLSTSVAPVSKPARPLSAFNIYMRERLKSKLPGVPTKEYFKSISSDWRQLSIEERNECQKIADEHYLEYDEQMKKYKDSLTKEDNVHRRLTKRLKKLEMEKLRKPKKVVTPYAFFIKEKFSENKKTDFAVVSDQWKSLSPEEKSVYEEMMEADKQRYYSEMHDWEQQMIREGRLDVVRAFTAKEVRGPGKSSGKKRTST